jgi:hypothetical protein
MEYFGFYKMMIFVRGLSLDECHDFSKFPMDKLTKILAIAAWCLKIYASNKLEEEIWE